MSVASWGRRETLLCGGLLTLFPQGKGQRAAVCRREANSGPLPAEEVGLGQNLQDRQESALPI